MTRVNAVVAACLLVFAGHLGAQTAPKVHELKASPQTVHRGFLDASLKPVLRINSGDIVKPETASGNPLYFEGLGVPFRSLFPAHSFRSATDTRRRGTAKSACPRSRRH